MPETDRKQLVRDNKNVFIILWRSIKLWGCWRKIILFVCKNFFSLFFPVRRARGSRMILHERPDDVESMDGCWWTFMTDKFGSYLVRDEKMRVFTRHCLSVRKSSLILNSRPPPTGHRQLNTKRKADQFNTLKEPFHKPDRDNVNDGPDNVCLKAANPFLLFCNNWKVWWLTYEVMDYWRPSRPR